MNYNNLLLKENDSILTITFNRPKSLNALNSETLKELEDAIIYANNNPEIKGIVLTGGECKAFVAGADIVQMLPYKAEEGRDYASFAQKVFNYMESIEKPVIAAVNGYALGGGCELAMSCDIRIASNKAKFGQPEVNLGVIPCFGGTQRLTRLVGVGMSKELIYTGRLVDASEAKAIGLVNKVVPSEDLLKEAYAMMESIINKAPLAIKYSKIAIDRGSNIDLYNALELEKNLAALCFASEDKNEGMGAFIEKRTPSFKNK
ncbi:enoyl-CoA hydratase-related protein [Clostridium malenominatum]|uniref:Enoyl-CoA hydratase-related protein n=1 Tax=Clostridium malenominatum TaxID=1539 RepID=A0ABP3U986_9CLOT